ncbi:MAG: hypothetical protein FJX77_14295 [Armatimonadetes bacterium]|nr:hypothetical protein [Armatimonadota bacterium]
MDHWLHGYVLRDYVEAPVETLNGRGLANAEFETLFAADLPRERIEFRVGGQAAWVELQPMDHGALRRFGMRSSQTMTPGLGVRADADEGAILTLEETLVSQTLVDWCLWRRRADGQMEEIRPSEVEAERVRQIKKWRMLPDFWDLLVQECSRVNKLDMASQGN